MATERNTSSVLYKLMGIDKLLPPRKTKERRRVLSENYLRNVSSVLYLEKSTLNADVNVFNMDVNEHSDCEETVSEGVYENVDSCLISENGDLVLKNYEVTFPPQRPIFSPRPYHKNLNSTNKNQKPVFGVRNKGLGRQEKRLRKLHHNSTEFSVRENMSRKQIAKQITHQVNNSVWHSSLKGSSSEGALEKRCEVSCFDPRKKYFQEVRISHGRKPEGRMQVYKSNARFLANPNLFPSTWVPGSKQRCFNLDRNWCSIPEKSSSMKTEKATLDKKMGLSRKPYKDQLPVKSSNSILFDDVMPSAKDFVPKHELKSTISPPRSPVSSLEGPEPCSHRLNFTLDSKQISMLPLLDEDDDLGLHRKLYQMEAMYSESSSEGHGMAISSDASDGGGSTGGNYREDAQIQEITSESLDFSYLVDVLIEFGMMTGNLELESLSSGSRNHMLNLDIFNFLEKKYGESSDKERSERRLLFDRINSALSEILFPSVGIHSWRKPVVKRLSLRRSHEFIEDEVWNSLMNEDLCDKILRSEIEWLDLEEDVDFIVQDMQSLLIDLEEGKDVDSHLLPLINIFLFYNLGFVLMPLFCA